MAFASRHESSSRVNIIARLLRLSWRYRARTLQVFLLQVVLLAMTLSGLRFSGLAIDVIRHAMDGAARIPKWPMGIELHRDWSLTAQLLLIALAIVATATIGALLNYAYSVTVARLVHLEIVPDLRAELFTRLQRLSFRFFDRNSNGAIVNRVTADVQMLRSFVRRSDHPGCRSRALSWHLSGVYAQHARNTHSRESCINPSAVYSNSPVLPVGATRIQRRARSLG